ncbi:MAG: ArsR family transcriptional regulator [Candidatus Thorarchaeota archaeon]|nr:ArsR family transcriptional regulator [Candidatus Thorarchaeota archaeon]
MKKPVIHVALLGSQTPLATEHLIIRRRVDEIIIVYTNESANQAEYLVDRFSSLYVPILPVLVSSNDFTNTLSSILRALDTQQANEYNIEFSIGASTNTLTLAGCIAAAITHASILYSNGENPNEFAEIWPSELVNLTHKKREILKFLESQACSTNQKIISEETGMMQSGISRHLNDLEKAGYVTRSRESRSKQVQITELGSSVLHQKQIRKRRVWGTYALRAPSSYGTVG